jgi:hypothetical protein
MVDKVEEAQSKYPEACMGLVYDQKHSQLPKFSIVDSLCFLLRLLHSHLTGSTVYRSLCLVTLST